jgi:hypothetical protein
MVPGVRVSLGLELVILLETIQILEGIKPQRGKTRGEGMGLGLG